MPCDNADHTRFHGVFFLPKGCGGCLACHAEQQSAKLAEAESERDRLDGWVQRAAMAEDERDEARQQLAELREAARAGLQGCELLQMLSMPVDVSGVNMRREAESLIERFRQVLTADQPEPLTAPITRPATAESIAKPTCEHEWFDARWTDPTTNVVKIGEMCKKCSLLRCDAVPIEIPDGPTPDPGEGWELCGFKEAEQSLVSGEWCDRHGGVDCHRRRKAMPANLLPEGPLWLRWPSGACTKYTNLSPGRVGHVVAWCVQLEGEEQAPAILTEWESE